MKNVLSNVAKGYSGDFALFAIKRSVKKGKDLKTLCIELERWLSKQESAWKRKTAT